MGHNRQGRCPCAPSVLGKGDITGTYRQVCWQWRQRSNAAVCSVSTPGQGQQCQCACCCVTNYPHRSGLKTKTFVFDCLSWRFKAGCWGHLKAHSPMWVPGRRAEVCSTEVGRRRVYLHTQGRTCVQYEGIRGSAAMGRFRF
jgi:hypothetical protein